MRATKGYVAGVGTTSALVGAIGCAFAVMSAVVAVQGWPLTLSSPGVTTVDGRAAGDADALPRLSDLFEGPADALAARRSHARTRLASRTRAGLAPTVTGPFASAFGPHDGAVAPASGGSGNAGSSGPGASAASPAPAAGGGTVPGQPGGGTATGGTGGSAPIPTGSDGSTTLGGAVTQVTSGAGTAVTQTGQQLSGAVQGTTGQLGGVVGQVSPAVGQVVTQTGQVAGGVVGGATGTAGQVVSGAGATVGGLLGRLTGGGRSR
jgi:hypothetical protein